MADRPQLNRSYVSRAERSRRISAAWLKRLAVPGLVGAVAVALGSCAATAPPVPLAPPGPVALTVANTTHECRVPRRLTVRHGSQACGEVLPSQTLSCQVPAATRAVAIAADGDDPELVAVEASAEGRLTAFVGCVDPALDRPADGMGEVHLRNLAHGCVAGRHGHVRWRLLHAERGGRPLGGAWPGQSRTRHLPAGVYTVDAVSRDGEVTRERLSVVAGRPVAVSVGCEGPVADAGLARLARLTVVNAKDGCAVSGPARVSFAGVSVELQVGEAYTLLLPPGTWSVTTGPAGEGGVTRTVVLGLAGTLVPLGACAQLLVSPPTVY